MKKVREYCKLVQIFPCSVIVSITHNNYKDFLDKYYPAIERSKTSIPKNHMQMMLVDQLNGNTKWQGAVEHKLARINTRFTLAMADMERKTWCKTAFRNSLFHLLGVRAHDFEYNDIIVALGLEGIETLDDSSWLTLE